MPADAGKYRVLPPRSIAAALLPTETAAAPLDTTSADAVHLRATSVWGSGDLTRFPGAVPVTALYDEEGSSWLYVWGAYGKLADPAGELSAFWSKLVAGPLADVEFPDTEPAGPLGGYLQCDDDFSTCAWADNSGIVVVSLSPPGSQSENIVFVGPPVSEQQLATMTRSFRAIAEVPAQRAHPPSPAPG
jgi:hypothetical protein